MTDKSSVIRDMEAWARITRNQIVDIVEEGGGVHFIRIRRLASCTMSPRRTNPT